MSEQEELDDFFRRRDQVTRTSSLAREAHEGQVDKLGEPYMHHIGRVMRRFDVDDETDAKTRAPQPGGQAAEPQDHTSRSTEPPVVLPSGRVGEAHIRAAAMAKLAQCHTQPVRSCQAKGTSTFRDASSNGRVPVSRSAIEWTEETWNPTTGCDRTSPGCDNCYALTLARRLKAMGLSKYQNDGDPRTSGPGFGITTHPDTLRLPRSWSLPRVIFVNSMSDLFHPKVPVGFIRDVFDVIADTPQHTYQVLTKRSKRLAAIAESLAWPANLWMGVSVEDDRYSFRIDHLRQIPASVRFLSCEPLLGPLDELDLEGIHWVIAGGESGPGARQINADWVRSIRDQCTEADVSFFFKQWGGRTPKARGRELDGATYSQMPRVPALS